MAITDIKADGVTVSYNIPTGAVMVKSVEIELNETESGKLRTLVRPAEGNGSISIGGLKSGNDYNVRIRSIAADGRLSDFTSPTTFTTGKF